MSLSLGSTVMTGDIRQVTRTVYSWGVCVRVVVCVSVSLRLHVTPCRRHCDIKLGYSGAQSMPVFLGCLIFGYFF